MTNEKEIITEVEKAVAEQLIQHIRKEFEYNTIECPVDYLIRKFPELQ